MDINSIYHRPRGSWAYALNNETIRLVIRTKQNDVKCVKVVHYDKYRAEEKYTEQMQLYVSDGLFDFWYVDVKPKYRRLAYHFVLDDKWCFHESGVARIGYTGADIHDFHYAYLNAQDVYNIPEWIKNSVIYQIFPDGFDNYGRKEKLSDEYSGGTIKGIIKNLDYLSSLGISVIYLNPIHDSTSYHRYDITDYFSVDNKLGTQQEYKKLIKECHKRNIRVIMDAVFNHVSYKNPFFVDVEKNGKNSKYYNWFIINSMKNNKPHSYETFAFVKEMPKLNTANKDVCDFILSVLKYWIEGYDIDGWRFDVGNEMGLDILRRIRTELKAIKKDIYLLGEIWNNPYSFVCGDMFDGATNFQLKFLLTDLANSKIDAKRFVNRYNGYYASLPINAHYASSNFICNHDTKRILSELGSITLVKFLIPFQFVLTGVPIIYYGEEIGMKNNPSYSGDKAARTLMEWQNADDELYDFYKKLIMLKRKNNCLIHGDSKVYSKGDLIFIERHYNEQAVILVANTSSKTKKYVSNEVDILTGDINNKLSPKQVKIFVK